MTDADGAQPTAPVDADASRSLRVFLSYSRRDRDVMRRLRSAVEGAGHDAWVDETDIPLTVDWFENISDGIRSSDVFVFLVSPDSLDSPVCGREVELAASLGKRIVPVLARDVGRAVAPEPIARRNWIHLDGDGGFARGAAELLDVLARDPAWQIEHTRWLVEADRWRSADRDSAGLLRGAELRAAKAWLATATAEQHDPPPTALQYEFILASERGVTRRQRVVLGGVLAALLVSVALGLVALVEGHRARSQNHLAQSRELAANAELNVGDDPELAVLLAARGAQIVPTAQATAALRDALLLSRVRATMTGSPAPLYRLAVRPGGRQVATSDLAGEVRLWAVDGRLQHVLRGSRFPAQDIAYSPDGKLLASGGYDGVVRLWNPSTGRPAGRLRTPEQLKLSRVAFSPDSRTLAVGSADGDATIHLYNVRSGRDLGRAGAVRGFVGSLAYRPDGAALLTWRDGKPTQIIDLRGGRVTDLGAAAPQTLAAVWSPDGRRVATGDSAGAVRVWDARSGRVIDGIQAGQGAVNAVAFSPDGRRIAAGGRDGDAVLWALGHEAVPLGNRGAGVTSLAFSPSGDVLATGSGDGTGRLWDGRSGALVATLVGHRSGVSDLAFLPSGREVVTASQDHTARVWLAAKSDFAPAAAPVRAAGDDFAVDAAGRSALVTSERGTASYRLGDGRAVGTLRLGATMRVLPVVGAGGSSVVTQAGETAPLTFRRLGAGGRSLSLAGSQGASDAAAISPDGRRLAASVAPNAVRIWDLRSGRLERTLRGGAGAGAGINHFVLGVAWSADGQRLASTSDDGTASIWDPGSGRRLHRLATVQPPGGMFDPHASVAWNPDGSRLVTTEAWDSTAMVWDTGSGTLTGRLEGDTDLAGARFSPDGELVLAVDTEGAARLWEPVGRALGGPFSAGPRADLATADALFSPDGRSLLVWNGHLAKFACEVCAPAASLVRLARTRVTRPLTTGERLTYLHQR